jgi:hypothetical protein
MIPHLKRVIDTHTMSEQLKKIKKLKVWLMKFITNTEDADSKDLRG